MSCIIDTNYEKALPNLESWNFQIMADAENEKALV